MSRTTDKYLLYKGKTPVKARDKVTLLNTDGDVIGTETVRFTLATQFLTNKQSFLFYGDKGVTWNKK